TIKGYGIKATEENSTGGHGFPLANGERIIDWVNEIYGGQQPPEEFLDWAKALRLDWEQKEAAKKAKAAASPPAIAPAVKKDKVQSGLAKAAVRAAQEGLPVYSISADVQGSTGISAFQKSLPDRFIEVGIAEANMVSTGAGFAKAGFIPIVDTFGQFGIEGKPASDHGGALPDAGHRHLLARGFSGCSRRSFAPGDHLLCRRQRH